MLVMIFTEFISWEVQLLHDNVLTLHDRARTPSVWDIALITIITTSSILPFSILLPFAPALPSAIFLLLGDIGGDFLQLRRERLTQPNK